MTPTNDGPVTVGETLRWYAENAAGCRKIGRDGDVFRQALDADGGRRALAALASAPAVLLHPADGENFGKWHMMLLLLINAVHRDNGEKTQAIGINAAFEQALAIVGTSRTSSVPTAAEAKPPSPPGYSLADMKRWHHLGHDDDGIPCD